MIERKYSNILMKTVILKGTETKQAIKVLSEWLNEKGTTISVKSIDMPDFMTVVIKYEERE